MVFGIVMPDKKKVCLYMLALLLLGSCFLPAVGQTGLPDFRQLTLENGLSHNWVKAILKDQQGYMWFGTFNGLNRYDGTAFHVFRAGEENGLRDDFIQALAEDPQGNIWVGTFSGGLHIFDRKTESFRAFRHQPDTASSLSSDKVNTLLSDRQGRLWIGTERGLDLYQPQSGSFRHYHFPAEDGHSPGPGLVSSLYEDHRGHIWVGTQNGLHVLEPARDSFRHFYHHPQQPASLAHDYVKSIYEDKYGNLWVGTWGGGLDRLSPDGQEFIHFRHQPNQPNSLSNDAVLSVLGDGENRIFVATEGGGLNIFDMQAERFATCLPDLTNPRSINSNSVHTLYHDPANGLLWAGTYNGGLNYFSKWDKPFLPYRAQPGGLNNPHVTCLAEDQEGRLWIGTDGGGVNVLDDQKGESFTYFTRENGLSSDAILSLLADRSNRLWVGSYNGGLDLIIGGKVVRSFRHDPGDSLSLGGKHVSAIYEDKRGNLWVGSMNAGLSLYLPETQQFFRYQHEPGNPYSLIDNFIYGILEDRKGRLLVQTGKGLEIFDYRQGTFQRFNQSLETDFGVPTALLEDSQANLWVGSKSMGLFRVDRTGVKVNSYTRLDGLPSNSISGILEDEVGNLWIGTQKGLCKFEEGVINPEKAQFHIYSVEDGLQGSEFKRGAYCLRKDGRMAFGGQNGFNLFAPQQIKNNPFIPPVVITNFRLFNKEIDFRENELLDAPISQTNVLSLTYKQSVFTFEFAALNYLHSEKNQYAYLMEGFEDTWNYVGTQNNATYTNLDPGTYTFRVKASNNDGTWNDQGTRLTLHILPPWWENVYFRAGLIALFLGGFLLIYKMRTYQLKRSKRELERQVALRTTDIQQMAEEIKDLNEAKIRFFTNISHELRTPLNLILWPLEELMQGEKESGKRADRYRLMYKNAGKLMRLINQLLDFRKIETGSLELRLVKKDVVHALRETADAFNDWAHRNDIAYRFESEKAEFEMAFDEDQLEKILSNLLSNAFKFTPKGGAITVQLAWLEGEMESPSEFSAGNGSRQWARHSRKGAEAHF
jgi:ligand-binding sensor domain-containing protein/signal transduction histidine kinase